MTKKHLVAAASAAALIVATPVSASAGTTYPKPPSVTTLSSQVGAPFNLAVSKGQVYVADGGTSLVSKVRGDGSLSTIATGPQPGEVAGLDFSANGRYFAYTSTGSTGQLTIVGPGGHRKTVDLGAYERRVNPDRKVDYGVKNPSPCVKKAFESIPDGPPASYKGLIDSHPYSVVSHGTGWIVADAAGNDLLTVDHVGNIRTLALLPPQPLKFTKATAGVLGLPSCVVGATYSFEPVPTDVEVGRDGRLYVTTLAGGPEDPRLGARSSVYKVYPGSGTSHRVGSGFSGATNLAIGKDGTIFVAELFGGQISTVKHGKARPYVALPGALSVESGPHGLFAGTLGGEEGPGSIVRIK